MKLISLHLQGPGNGNEDNTDMGVSFRGPVYSLSEKRMPSRLFFCFMDGDGQVRRSLAHGVEACGSVLEGLLRFGDVCGVSSDTQHDERVVLSCWGSILFHSSLSAGSSLPDYTPSSKPPLRPTETIASMA